MARRRVKVRSDLFRPAARGSGQPTGENNPVLEFIWHTISSIPRGKVSTYGAVAEAAGLPGRARQVAYALRVAPDDLELPWHRVMGAGGRIAFAAGSRGYREQARRLRAEGVQVRDGRVNKESIAELGGR